MIPKYDELYVPVLNALAELGVHTNKKIVDAVANAVGISDDDRRLLVPSGKKPIFSDRVNWAITYLRKAGLIESVKRGQHQLTEEGRKVLSHLPPVLNNEYLCRYPEFEAFVNHPTSSKKDDVPLSSPESSETPDDLIARATAAINQKLADDLMLEILAKDSDFFESLVVALLRKMGYGGSISDAGIVTKRSNDGGIDGIIREDKLGFDQIYIQAKRWDTSTTISRPEIQKFYGALAGVGASKGLFITTAKFSDGAKQYADQQHIVLVDGERLTKLMIEYDLGVSSVAVYQIKTIDTDFFSDEE